MIDLKAVREKHGISYDEMRKRCGLGTSDYVLIENGHQIPTPLQAWAIAHVVGCDVADILPPLQGRKGSV